MCILYKSRLIIRIIDVFNFNVSNIERRHRVTAIGYFGVSCDMMIYVTAKLRLNITKRHVSHKPITPAYYLRATLFYSR